MEAVFQKDGASQEGEETYTCRTEILIDPVRPPGFLLRVHLSRTCTSNLFRSFSITLERWFPSVEQSFYWMTNHTTWNIIWPAFEVSFRDRHQNHPLARAHNKVVCEVAGEYRDLTWEEALRRLTDKVNTPP